MGLSVSSLAPGEKGISVMTGPLSESGTNAANDENMSLWDTLPAKVEFSIGQIQSGSKVIPHDLTLVSVEHLYDLGKEVYDNGEVDYSAIFSMTLKNDSENEYHFRTTDLSDCYFC